MKLDSVLTIAIGRNGSDNKPMWVGDWDSFKYDVKKCVNTSGTIVFTGNSDSAIGSDGANEGQEEDSYAIIVINIDNINELRANIAGILVKYGQGSACFALDKAHEPAFSTITGNREQ